MQCLALDVGSSSIKGAVLDLEADRIALTVSRPFPAPLPSPIPGAMEISTVEICQHVQSVLNELLPMAPDADRLLVSGQMGGVVLVDAAGKALSNYLSWRDQRTLQPGAGGRSCLDEIRERWSAELLATLGNELQPGSATSLLHWLSQRKELPQGAIPSTVADFAIGQLCGVQPRMHVTQAIGMLDLRSGEWHREAFDRLGLEGLQLPQLSQRPEPIGVWKHAGRALQVFGAYGDQQCALYGAKLRRGELSLNISTGSQVSIRTNTFEPGPYQTRMFFDGDWLNTITHLPAGRSLNVLVDLLLELAAAEGLALKNPWQHILQRASQVESTSLQVDLAFFSGPLGSSGGVTQITTENLTVGHLFHACFRAMADNYVRCASWLDPQQSWQAVVLSGGLTQSAPLLRKMLEQRFNAPLRDSHGEETLLGLLQLARVTS